MPLLPTHRTHGLCLAGVDAVLITIEGRFEPAGEGRTEMHLTGLPDPVNAAETLIRFGYLEPESLTGICRAWRNLIDCLRPDLLFCDFAPTALLATRGTGLRTAVSDTGYGIPPAI